MIQHEIFIRHLRQRLVACRQLGENCLNQLEAADFDYRPNLQSNSIAIILQHLYGNMMSRFTHFLTEDGEKSWRKREAEFEPMDMEVADLLDCWQTGWSQVLHTIDTLQPGDLMKTVRIRGEEMPAFEALLRQLAHYAYHIGQIIYVAKLRRGAAFTSLSIPRDAPAV